MTFLPHCLEFIRTLLNVIPASGAAAGGGTQAGIQETCAARMRRYVLCRIPERRSALPRWSGMTMLLFLFLANPAQAACSSPAGAAGKIIYNADHKIVQYCDNTNWIPAGLPGSGSGGCSSPSRAEGTILYNADQNVMQFCGGSVWVPMGFPASAAELSSGLQGHWKLDESSGTSAADSSGNGHTGTTSGSPTWQPTGGIIGGGLSFDGTDDCVVMPYTTDLELSSGESITIAGWHKSSSVTSDTIVFSDNQSNMNYMLGFDSGGYIVFSYNDTGQTYSSSATYSSADTWQHIAFTFTPGTGSSAKLYVNGSLVGGSWSSGTGNVAPVADGRPVSIGCWNSNGTPESDYVSATIDDVRIYNRILTATEIAALVTEKNALVAHYKLDESSGTTAADSSGYANDGTLQGPPYSTWSAAGGRIGGAFYLNSTDGSSTNLQGIAVPGAAQIDNLSTKTIAAWVKAGPDNENVIAQKYAGGNDDGWLLRRINDTSINFINWFNGGVLDADWAGVLSDDGQWHHVAVTFSGLSTDNASLYLDGALVSSIGATSSYPMGDDSSAQMFIGNHSDWPTAAVDGGYLDDVRIYNYVLSAAEIGALAAVNADTSTGLVGHWKLDESSGTSAADSSGNGNTGTLDNFAASPPWDTTGGQVEGTLTFDGTNDTITIDSSPASLDDLETQGGGGLSVALWMKMSSNTSGNNYLVTKSIWPTLTGQWFFALINNSGSGDYFSFVKDYATTDLSVTFIDCAEAMNVTEWNHVALSWDGGSSTAGVKAYVNGTPCTSNGGPDGAGAKVSDAADNMTIAYYNNGSFLGDLDDVRVYNRVLNGADIATLAQSFPGDCDAPKGYKGEMIYNSTKTMMQYCDGTSWVAVGKNAGSYASDLIAHWKFDETSGTSAADSTGNGHTGTLTNSPSWQGTAGKRGGAILLDGANDYVTAGDINAAEGIATITVSTWAKTSVAGEQDIVTKSNCDGSQDPWALYSGWPTADGKAAFLISGADGTNAYSGQGTTAINDGSWHMLTGVYDGAYVRIYVDGVEENSAAYVTSSIYSNTHNVEIGGYCNGNPFLTNGLIDEVRIYGRALSASEIMDLYNATNGTPGVETRTVFLATNSGAKYNGNLGGQSGADTKCNTEAAAAGLLGTYKAWISITADATHDPDSLFTGIGGSYTYLLPSGTKVADNWADLIDGSLDSALNENASGTSQASGNVWTNVTTAGARDGTTNNTHGCVTWGSALNTRSGNVGTAGNTDNTWTDTGGFATCNTTAYLYCFQQ